MVKRICIKLGIFVNLYEEMLQNRRLRQSQYLAMADFYSELLNSVKNEMNK